MYDCMSDLNDVVLDFSAATLDAMMPIIVIYILIIILKCLRTWDSSEKKTQKDVVKSTTKVKVKISMSIYQVYLKEIKSFVESIRDSDISQKLKILVEVLQKVPKRYFSEERFGKYYIPELLLLLRSYCNLLDKDSESKTSVLEGIETVTDVAKSILNTLDESEKMKLEINSDVLNQVAKMDGYLSDTTFDSCSEKKLVLRDFRSRGGFESRSIRRIEND